jgi:hypothetical protein
MALFLNILRFLGRFLTAEIVCAYGWALFIAAWHMDVSSRGVVTHGHFLRVVNFSVYFLSFILFLLFSHFDIC